MRSLIILTGAIMMVLIHYCTPPPEKPCRALPMGGIVFNYTPDSAFIMFDTDPFPLFYCDTIFSINVTDVATFHVRDSCAVKERFINNIPTRINNKIPVK
jgi:hypothetical protein